MQGNDAKKIIAALVLFGVAAGLYWYLSADDSSDAGGDIRSHWHCSACRKTFELAARELKDSVTTQERDVNEVKQEGPQMRGRGAQRTFSVAKCPHCGQWTGDAARECPGCGEVFPSKTRRGVAAICPKCHWDSRTGRKAEGDRLTEGLDPAP
ncbi:MAG TPA: hypothetical protein VNT79_12610 [Phycisphaerae bacterium]|nr:hypothetical protein [Phycisphaerae bacterium]